MSIIVAVDIGGTQIRAATYTLGNTKALKVTKIPTKSSDSQPYDRVVRAIASIWPASESVSCITAAIPGPLDPETGIVISAPNIPGWEHFPLAQKLQERFSVPVYLGNDANMAAMGEWRFGAGQGHKHVLYFTISTGIGGGVIADNQLLTGWRGLATELGHVILEPDGPLCGCGKRGHFEALASGTAIARYVNEQLAAGVNSQLKPSPSLGARQVADAAREGDTLAIEAFARAGKYIGLALANYVVTFNPSIVIFGGGVSFSGDLLFAPMRTALKENVMDLAYIDGLEITTAQLGDDAGLLGALALGIYKTKHDN
jgi:glucokinase